MNSIRIFAITIAVLTTTTLFAGYVYAETSIVQDTTTLITAFGALLGSIGGIIVAAVGFLSNRSKGNVISEDLRRTFEDLQKVGLSLQKTDRWVLENEEKFATLIRVVTEINPKIKNTLQEKNVEIKKLEEELTKAKQELDTIYDTIVPKIKVS